MTIVVGIITSLVSRVKGVSEKNLKKVVGMARMPSMVFREKLVRMAKSRGWDLKWIAHCAEIPYNSLRRYAREGSTAAPDAPKGIRLAKMLGVPVEWLFDDDQGWPPPPPWQKGPPFPIYPWPPHGISWAEVQYAIWEFLVLIHRNAMRSGEAPPDLRERTRQFAEAVLKELQNGQPQQGASHGFIQDIQSVVLPDSESEEPPQPQKE